MTRFVMVLDADDLAGLDALARLDGSPGGDLVMMKKLAAGAMRDGLSARLEREGLPWAAQPDVVAARLAMPKPRQAPDGVAGHATPSRLAMPLNNKRIRLTGLTALVTAAVVALIGGYVARWAWTGFASNNQLWDWMNLLLLPVAFGTLPLWLRFSEHMSRTRKLIFACAIVTFAVFVVFGYLLPIGWTGFAGNTLWNWLTLIVLPATVISVRAWPTSRREIRTPHLVVISAIGTGLIVTLIGGYAAGWQWTGYPGNTLWDWMQLLLAPIVINSVLIPRAVRWVSGDVERLATAQVAREDAADSVAVQSATTAPTPEPAVRAGRGSSPD